MRETDLAYLIACIIANCELLIACIIANCDEVKCEVRSATKCEELRLRT